MHNDWNEHYSGILKHQSQDETREHKLSRLLDYVSKESLENFPGQELRITGHEGKTDFIVKEGKVFMAYEPQLDSEEITLKRFLRMREDEWEAHRN